MSKTIPQEVKTIEITNFGGRLTRVLNGAMNSGFAKFASSWGYDPFSKPGNLTWNYATSSIAGIQHMPLAGIKTQDPFFYLLDNTGLFYWMKNSSASYVIGPGNVTFNPLDDAVVSVLGTVPDSYNYGGSMENFAGNVYVTGDSSIATVMGLPSPTFNSVVGTTGSVVSGIPHPLQEFVGKLYYGNGNNIGEISSGIVTTGSKLSPALPTGMVITDLDVTPEGDYLLITASFASPPYLGPVDASFAGTGNFQNYSAQSTVFYWNGTDTGYTSFRSLPSFPATALSTFLDKQYTVMQDTFGMALMEGNQKLLTLPNNLVPEANALTPNGTFVTWVSPEGTGPVNAAQTRYSSVFASLYYYGRLDEENPNGLYRMDRISPISGAYTIQYAPFNAVINNFSFYGDAVWGFGKHFIGTQDAKPTNYSSVVGRLHRFTLNPTANTTPTNGVYETQTELFSKRIALQEVRVYCEPTVAGNAFQLDIIGGDGNPVAGGTFTYTFGDILDPQTNSQSVERINFSPSLKTLFACAIRFTNLGSVNMTVRKIEVDYSQEGK